MDGGFVLKGNHPQHATLPFLNDAPKLEAVTLLGLDLKRVFDDLNAPFFFEVWALP
jgi:hypothetical protein